MEDAFHLSGKGDFQYTSSQSFSIHCMQEFQTGVLRNIPHTSQWSPPPAQGEGQIKKNLAKA